MKRIYEPELDTTSFNGLLRYAIVTIVALALLTFRSQLYEILNLTGTVLRVATILGNALFVIFVISLYPIIVEFLYVIANKAENNSIKSYVIVVRYMCLFFALAAITMIVFFYTQYAYKHIEKTEAEIINVHFKRLVETSGHTSDQYIQFTDYRDLNFLGDSDLLMNVEQGTELIVFKHPTKNLVLEINEENQVLISFDTTMRIIDRERELWMLLIISLDVLLIGCILVLFLLRIKKNKTKLISGIDKL